MHNRDTAFHRKFESAAQILGANKSEIVSVKIREVIANHRDYDEFVRILELLTNITLKPIKASLQGNGYLLEDEEKRIIFVEHETGLEILYIAGSIASLIQLIPFIINLWRGRRNRFDYPMHYLDEGIEIRRINNKGQLIEVRDANISLNLEVPILAKKPSLATSNDELIDQINQMQKELLKINKRVENIEKLSKKGVSKKKKSKNK